MPQLTETQSAILEYVGDANPTADELIEMAQGVAPRDASRVIGEMLDRKLIIGHIALVGVDADGSAQMRVTYTVAK